jgi:hypothetical protein
MAKNLALPFIIKTLYNNTPVKKAEIDKELTPMQRGDAAKFGLE